MNRPFPSMQQIRLDVPVALDAIFFEKVAKRPRDRYRSLAEVIRDREGCRQAETPVGVSNKAKKTVTCPSRDLPVSMSDGIVRDVNSA